MILWNVLERRFGFADHDGTMGLFGLNTRTKMVILYLSARRKTFSSLSTLSGREARLLYTSRKRTSYVHLQPCIYDILFTYHTNCFLTILRYFPRLHLRGNLHPNTLLFLISSHAHTPLSYTTAFLISAPVLSAPIFLISHSPPPLSLCSFHLDYVSWPSEDGMLFLWPCFTYILYSGSRLSFNSLLGTYDFY